MDKDPQILNLAIAGDIGISVVVPLYCSRGIIFALFDRISKQLSQITDDWEIILVDDCSLDGTWNAACDLNNLDSRVKCIRLARNHGQQHSTLCGLRYASKSFVITIDDDLQCFPEDIPLFIEKLKSGSRVVIGRIKTGRKKHKWWRNLASYVNNGLAGKIIGKPKTIWLSSFRGMTLDVVKKIIGYKGAHPHIAALLFKLVPIDLICNVDIRHAQRLDGTSSTYSLPKLVKTISYLVINHSYVPLRYMVLWGIFLSSLAMAYALWVALRVLIGDYSLPGWASLAILVSFLSGNVLLALGILGEYVGRLVEEASSIEQFSVFEERL
jgi:polyisoprenyl-phosphate glycosyltransferase